jgi:hypothetical protein
MTPEGQKPSQWLCLAKFPREMYSQPIVHKALSWGTIRKSACILAEITIRKSQRLSLQVAGSVHRADRKPVGQADDQAELQSTGRESPRAT